MMIGSRNALTSVAVGLAIAAGSFSTLAQEPSAKKSAEKAAAAPAVVAKKKSDPSRRVPDYFGQIGLNPEQRESIYKIRKSHQDKIDALKKQIADVEAKSLVECEAVLTDTQKKLVENLRSAGSRASKYRRRPGETH